MTLDTPAVRQRLAQFDFTALFTQELGWDFPGPPLSVAMAGREYALQPVADKRGVRVLHCPTNAGEVMPDYRTRQQIERQVLKSAHEHLLIFTDAAKTTQIWQWVSRVPGQPAAYREHTYHPRTQSGEALLQKLDSITIPLSDEEGIDLTGAVQRLRDAFDRDRVTRRFYDHFKQEHATFLKFISGIKELADKEWYASLMLNRLMFVYFIQKKGFLDGDLNYLQDRLAKVRSRGGTGKFHTFYRYFLLCLFHEGFSKQPAARKLAGDLAELLGTVPYLNGGLFDVHEIEQRNDKIDIPDEAFERLFGFFDQYDWHLDNRPLRNDREINPDVLGYIFEKYINQKQMGAYYTKEDITDYISKNTIVPWLFDTAKKKCAVAFQNDSASWRLLKQNPDEYLYPAVRQGVIDDQGQVIPLPAEIEAGVADVSKRDGWNRAAPQPFALPTETWREHVARRQRCLELRKKLAAGEVHEINDLITFNLDIRQFAADCIAECEGPELLRAFYYSIAGRVPEKSTEKAVPGISVLDPTCGSGAFLFAALNILKPLYEACLDRMQAFVDDQERASSASSPRRAAGRAEGPIQKFDDFRKILADVARHPNREYFILKSIIVHNLYGVDIMEEAVEICKLRLFLKLVAQVEKVTDLEPLPDIDFNIRPGNTLVGYATLEEVRRAVERESSGQKRLGFSESQDAVLHIEEEAEIVDRAFRKFHEMQTHFGMDGSAFAESKRDLRERLDRLSDELNRYLAGEYGVDPAKPKKFAEWLASHQPFHWFAEFYGAINRGGFAVIIGNPPYVEYSKVRKDYQIRGFQTEPCGNLYAMCIERGFKTLADGGRFGFIVQAPIVSTQRMAAARNVLGSQSKALYYSTYDDRPSKLFDGMHHCRLAIVISEKGQAAVGNGVFSTRYHKWYKEERGHLFQTIGYLALPTDLTKDLVPKFRSASELSAYTKVLAQPRRIGGLMSPSPTRFQIFYKITGVGHWFSFALAAPKFWRNGNLESSTRESTADFPSTSLRDVAYCCLCSSLHYWIYQARTNCRDFNPSDLTFLPISDGLASSASSFSELAAKIMNRLEETSELGEGNYRVGGSVRFQKFRPKTAKDLSDQVDAMLGPFYGFSPDELDFIINYDIKYRMGQDESEEDE